MATIDFIPKHNQPFSLEQAMLLEIDVLVAEIRRLENSIKHLERTQEELISFLRDEPDEDEDGEIGKAKQENDEVIASQKERITLIKVALINKVGEGGAKHYGLDTGPAKTDSGVTSQAGRGSTGQTANSSAMDPGTTIEQEDQGGVYL